MGAFSNKLYQAVKFRVTRSNKACEDSSWKMREVRVNSGR